MTADPTVLGLAARSGQEARLAVEFDHNGDDVVDGSTQTDPGGNFRYSPVGLADGAISLRSRVAEWDPANWTKRLRRGREERFAQLLPLRKTTVNRSVWTCV